MAKSVSIPRKYVISTAVVLTLLAASVIWLQEEPAQLTYSQFGNTSLVSPRSIAENYARLPMSFEENRGQSPVSADFIARGDGYTVALAPTEAVFRLRKVPAVPANRTRRVGHDQKSDISNEKSKSIRMQLINANPLAPADRCQKLAGRVNYLIGREPEKWNRDVEMFSRVAYRGVYSGIDVVYYGNQRELEYDFVVAPGHDPGQIAIGFEGASSAAIEPGSGDLVIILDESAIRQRKPFAYQESGGIRTEVASRYTKREDGTIGFEIGEYDTDKELTIDPVLTYSTYLGGAGSDIVGSFDFDRVIAVDSAGNAYITGETSSADFPATTGSFDIGFNGGRDVFVTKLNAAGTALVYSTFLGGSGADSGFGLAVDASGSVYITGETASDNFPTTAGAFDTTRNGNDAFVTKLDPSGASLVYSTFLGGTSDEFGVGIAVDSTGSVYVSGSTPSTNFPTTAGVFDTTYNTNGDIFVTRLNTTGTALVYSTYLGGTGEELVSGLALDAAGNAHVTGETSSTAFPTTTGAFDTTIGGSFDAYVTKLNAGGTALLYSTYLGGGSDDSAQGVALDSAGGVLVAGLTTSSDFPVTAGSYDPTYNGGVTDAFVTKVTAVSGMPLAFSTFLGGAADETAHGIAVDTAGRAHLTGTTTSTNFPVTVDGYDTSINGGSDVFLTTLNGAGSSLFYSTYIGGAGEDEGSGIAIGPNGDVYLAGVTLSSNFPTTAGAYDGTYAFFDAFVARLGSFGTPTPTPTSTPTATATPTATPTPTQTTTVTGLVTTPSGSGLRNATVFLTDAQGIRRSNITNSFGFYTFNDVPVGFTYTISVKSSRYRFAAQQRLITGNTNVDFVGLE
ncbi:MAG: SBBP repeat-containing protein [Pyrinomonadaceae bacterium]